MLEAPSELLHLHLQLRTVDATLWKHVDLVHRDNEFIHQYLSKHYALSSLRLDQLLSVDNQHHEVDYARATNNSLHQACMPRAVDKRELQELVLLECLTVLGPEPLRYSNYKGRKAKV